MRLSAVKLRLGDLADKSDEILDVLRRRLSARIEKQEGTLTVHIDPKRPIRKGLLRTYLRRYLHSSRLNESHRVRVSGEELSIVRLKEKAE